MGILIFILLVAFLLMSVFIIVTANDVGGVVCGIVLFLVLFACGVVIPYVSHNSSLANIENSAAIVKIQEDYKERLKSQLESLPKVNASLMNADSPYKAIVSEIAVAEQKIATANETVLDSKISIQKRERGMTSYILWFF